MFLLRRKAELGIPVLGTRLGRAGWFDHAERLFVDADYASIATDRRSISGSIVVSGGRRVI